jgi:hypothetical protein
MLLGWSESNFEEKVHHRLYVIIDRIAMQGGIEL